MNSLSLRVNNGLCSLASGSDLPLDVPQAGGLALLGQQLSVPFPVNLGLLSLGLMLVIMGGELIITRRAEFAIGGFACSRRWRRFTGLAAQLWA